MATQPKTTGLTYENLQDFPDDNLRREIIDGELVVTSASVPRHQWVVAELVTQLVLYCHAHGGRAAPAPLDVYLAANNVVEPDVVHFRPETLVRVEEKYVRGPPDLVVEVSSPSTRRLELVRKRELYERFGVPEYWFVDLDADRIEVYRLESGRYGPPVLFGRRNSLQTPQAPGLTLTVDSLLGEP